MNLSSGVLVALSALGATDAGAAIIRQTYLSEFSLRVLDVLPEGEEYPPLVIDDDGSFGVLRDVDFAFGRLPQFTGAPGSLLGVELSLFSVVDGDWRFDDEIGYAKDFDTEGIFFRHNDTSVSVQAFYALTVKPFIPDLFPALYAASARGSCDSGDIDATFLIGGVAILCPAVQTGFVPPLFRHEWGPFEGAAEVAPFLGTGDLQFYALAEGEHWGTCDHDDDGDVCYAYTSLAWEGIVSVTYIIQTLSEIEGSPVPPVPPGVVPAPAAVLLLLGGLAGIGAARRRA